MSMPAILEPNYMAFYLATVAVNIEGRRKSYPTDPTPEWALRKMGVIDCAEREEGRGQFKRVVTDEQAIEIYKMRQTGARWWQIAEAFGISHTSAQNYVARVRAGKYGEVAQDG